MKIATIIARSLWRYCEHFAGLVKNAATPSALPRQAIATGNATVNS